MKTTKRILFIVIALVVSLFATSVLTACDEMYTAQQTDELIAKLEQSIDDNKADLDKKISDLTAEYKAKDAELLQAINKNKEDLLAHKTAYETQLGVLQKADADNKQAIEDLTADYNAKVEELETVIETAKTAIENNKAELEQSISLFKTVYENKVTELENLITTIQNTDKSQEDKIAELVDKVAALEKATRIVDVKFENNGDLTITFGDGSTQTVKAPEKHVHDFGDWVCFSERDTTCENRLFYRICTECKSIEWKQGSYEDHDFIMVTTPPTCQAQGYDAKTCKICGIIEKKVNYTDIIDHAWADKYSYDNSYHWIDCDTCDDITDKNEHKIKNSSECSVCHALAGPTAGVLYEVVGNNARIIGYEGNATNIVIADNYNGKPVIEICANAFKNNSIVEIVVIPDSVTTIGNSAFSGCTNLTNVIIGNSVNKIDSMAFHNCTSLTNITIPDNVTTIGSFSFCNCTSLTNITIPDNVTTIGNSAFENCPLTNVICPTFSISHLPKNNLENIIISSGNTIDKNTFSGCDNLTSVTIGDSVTSIGTSAFSNCDNLTSVTIGDSVTFIGNSAFSGCNKLTSVTIPDSITTIDARAFEHCTNLTNVTIPDSVMTIGYRAFYGCYNLTIYCEANSEPSGWNSYWYDSRTTVIWGYKGE